MAISFELRPRIWRDDAIAIGPGKADLLDAIAETGSISAAARAMNMSYRRAWLLVDAMNRSFREPLVATLAGGKQGGGAHITDAGHAVLVLYRTLQRKAKAAIQDESTQLAAMLLPPDV